MGFWIISCAAAFNGFWAKLKSIASADAVKGGGIIPAHTDFEKLPHCVHGSLYDRGIPFY